MKVRDKASQANEAVLLVRGIKAQIQDRKGKLDATRPRRSRRRWTTSRRRSARSRSEIYQVKLQSSQDPLNFPIKLNNKIAALQGVDRKRRRAADRAGVFRVPHAVEPSRRAARQAGYDVEDADAAGQSAAAAAEARSDQGGAAENRAAEDAGRRSRRQEGGKGRKGRMRWREGQDAHPPPAPSCPSCLSCRWSITECASRDGISSAAACRASGSDISRRRRPRARASTGGCATCRTAASRRPPRATPKAIERFEGKLRQRAAGRAGRSRRGRGHRAGEPGRRVHGEIDELDHLIIGDLVIDCSIEYRMTRVTR